MKPAIRIAMCAAAAFSLSGCQSFVSALGFGPKDKEAQRAEASTSVFGKDELEQGRLALKSGYPANAIQLFRLAALDEGSAPDAFNGLGVAYAKLGRADLAERYFKMAVSLDGSNPKFAGNLDRFYNSALGNSHRALAMREQAAREELAAAAKAADALGLLQPLAQESERRGALTLEKPSVQMSRTSRREIRLSTGSAETGRGGALPAVAVRNPAKEPKAEQIEDTAQLEDDAAPSAKPAERKTPTAISLLGRGSSGESYPVRISLTKPQSGKSTPAARANYPLRVALASTSKGD